MSRKTQQLLVTARVTLR